MRNVYGKTPNFLIGYGGGAYRLHQQTGIAIERAQEIIDHVLQDRSSDSLPWKNRELAHGPWPGAVGDERWQRVS